MRFPGFRLLFNIFVFFILSSILVHFFALLGVFLAFAYPIWWLFFPDVTICLACQSTKIGETCRFCHRKRTETDKPSPKTFPSALYNGAVILLVSFFSLGLVVLEFNIFTVLGLNEPAKTVSFVIPPKGQYRIGEIFPMKIEVSGVERPINTIQADLGFDPDMLEMVDISTQDSIATVFVQKEISNEGGYCRLTGGLPNPGFSDARGLFGTAYFKGKKPGIVSIRYLPSSLILANDGKGTNMLKEYNTVSYLILPERISQEEQNNQKQITLNTDVLGARTSSTQLTFYNELRVLGESTIPDIKTAPTVEVPEDISSSPLQVFIQMLSAIDHAIIRFWEAVTISLLRLFK